MAFWRSSKSSDSKAGEPAVAFPAALVYGTVVPPKQPKPETLVALSGGSVIATSNASNAARCVLRSAVPFPALRTAIRYFEATITRLASNGYVAHVPPAPISYLSLYAVS